MIAFEKIRAYEPSKKKMITTFEQKIALERLKEIKKAFEHSDTLKPFEEMNAWIDVLVWTKDILWAFKDYSLFFKVCVWSYD